VGVAVAASLCSAASADTFLLDIPDGVGTDITWSSESGAVGSFFDISAEHLNFYATGYGTPGVVFAWDYASQPGGVDAVGSLELSVFDPSEMLLSGVAFDISGYLDRESNSAVRVYADDSVVFEADFSLAGASEVATVAVEFGASSSVRIELENTSPWAWTGLDNIAVSGAAVPAPGALALLGVAGIVGGRRRRTA